MQKPDILAITIFIQAGNDSGGFDQKHAGFTSDSD